LGGSLSEEERLIKTFAGEIREVQEHNKARDEGRSIRRALHAKTHAGIVNAEFRVPREISGDLATGVFVPGAVHRALVRFSNAAGTIEPDSRRDLRGVAIRVVGEDGGSQDFVLTNAPASHARDAHEFMVAAKASAGKSKAMAALALVKALGLREAWRMLRSLASATSRDAESLATERFWSRAPFALGPIAVKFTLVPTATSRRAALATGDNYLRDDLTQRLQDDAVRFRLRAQRYVDDSVTPIEDGTVEWNERDAPPEDMAELVIPQQDLTTAAAREAEVMVDRLAFSPWNTSKEIRPIGSLNRARRLVYESSAAHRGFEPRPADQQ
jgi:catalase